MIQQYNIKLVPQTFQFYKVLVTFRWILILPVYQAKFSLPYVSIMNSSDKVQFNLSWINLLHHWHLIKLCSTWYCQAKSKQTITEFWRWKQAKISTRCLAPNKSVQMTSFSRSPKDFTFAVLIFWFRQNWASFFIKRPLLAKWAIYFSAKELPKKPKHGIS